MDRTDLATPTIGWERFCGILFFWKGSNGFKVSELGAASKPAIKANLNILTLAHKSYIIRPIPLGGEGGLEHIKVF